MQGSSRVFRILILVAAVLGGECEPASDRNGTGDGEDLLKVVATTSMIADLANVIGGDRVAVTGLMGPGVDPHLYKASEGDVTRMAEAELILYNGWHLEGKMTEIFEQMQSRGIPTVAVAEAVDPGQLIESPNFAGNYDPHVWFDASLWLMAARRVQEALSERDPSHAILYKQNADRYADRLEELDIYIRERVAEVPEAQRVLVTSHDAFGYFGRAYGFEVRGLQGLSTASEAGTADVQELAAFVAERRIPAMFVESSVSPRGIQAVREAVRARGFDVRIGGTLYGDALGNPGTPEETYIGTVRYNIDTIVEALTLEAAV